MVTDGNGHPYGPPPPGELDARHELAGRSESDELLVIQGAEFLDEAAARGLRFYTGVPCSYLTPLINQVASSRTLSYVGAASEGEAVAIAAGAWLAGQGTAVICQNSGLGNAVNPLTSLNHPFRIPTLLICTWRGEPGRKDEPQHRVMGRITQDLLRTIEVPQGLFPRQTSEVGGALDAACASMGETGLPFALVMHQDSVAPSRLDEAPRTRQAEGRRIDWRAMAPSPRAPRCWNACGRDPRRSSGRRDHGQVRAGAVHAL